jgi:hypothetical protein
MGLGWAEFKLCAAALKRKLRAGPGRYRDASGPTPGPLATWPGQRYGQSRVMAAAIIIIRRAGLASRYSGRRRRIWTMTRTLSQWQSCRQ